MDIQQLWFWQNNFENINTVGGLRLLPLDIYRVTNIKLLLYSKVDSTDLRIQL